MDRPDIIRELDALAKIKDKAIALYARYTSVRPALSDLKEADRNRIDAIFGTLLKDSERHKITLANLLNRTIKNEPYVHDDEL